MRLLKYYAFGVMVVLVEIPFDFSALGISFISKLEVDGR